MVNFLADFVLEMKIYFIKWLTMFDMVNPSWSRDKRHDGQPWTGGQTVARVSTLGFTIGLTLCFLTTDVLTLLQLFSGIFPTKTTCLTSNMCMQFARVRSSSHTLLE